MLSSMDWKTIGPFFSIFRTIFSRRFNLFDHWSTKFSEPSSWSNRMSNVTDFIRQEIKIALRFRWSERIHSLSIMTLLNLPPLETKVEGVFQKCQTADRDFIDLLLHWHYVEVLQQSGYCREANVLNHLVAHAGSPAATERQEMLRLQKSAVL